MIINDILPRLKGLKRSGSGWIALCPAHDDKRPSLSIKEKDGRALVYCFAKCAYADIVAALDISPTLDTGRARHVSSNGSTPDKTNEIEPKDGNSVPDRQIIEKRRAAEYEYTDNDGKLLYQIVRYEVIYSDGYTDKKFVARRRPAGSEAGSQGGWVYKMEGIQLALYNLVGITDSHLVYVVEGEKDVDTLAGLGVAATCNPFGAGKWRNEFNEALRGKTVVILPDNDAAGRTHAAKVATALDGIAEDIAVIDLPGLPEKGDVTDWVNGGGTADDLMDLVGRADSWQPTNAIAKSPAVASFNFTTLETLLEEPPEDVSFVWDDTLPTGGFSICSAKPKVGKSTLARNLAVAVATGQPFIGRETQPGKVLYLCLEEKRSEIRNHFERMGIVSDQILIHTGSTPKETLLGLAAAIDEFKPVLVIIDPLSRVIRVPDFNDYGSMSRGLEPLIDLARRSGCHILSLHHDSKMERSGGDALLGSTALFGAVDCHIQLKKRDSSRTVSTTQRYGEDLDETVVELDKDTGLISAGGDLQSVRTEKVKNAIIAALGENEALDEKEIKVRVEGYNRGEISKALRSLVDDGVLSRSGEGKRGNAYNYSKSSTWVN